MYIRLEEGRFICSELGKGATSETGSIYSQLLICGGGVHSMLLLPLVVRCLETIDVCIWCMFVFCCRLWECLLCIGCC